MSVIHAAAEQSWPPFVLVTGLLLIGQVAGRDGLFAAVAARLADLRGPTVALLLACYALVALVTATLNLDTAALFLTPVLIGVARNRQLDLKPFLYGSIFMVNASSLFLPGSNLTNLLVLSRTHRSGGAFFVHMLPIAAGATLATAGGLLVIHRRHLRPGSRGAHERVELKLGAGFWGALAAAVLMVLLRSPALAALAVLAVGLLAAGLRVAQGQLSVSGALARLGLPVLVGLFCLAVALGALARASGFPGDAMHSVSAPFTAVIAALASVLVNNLPAAVLLSARAPLHPDALLLGLNVGPNLTVSGSLSVLLWWRAAREVGVRPSAREYSRQGLLLVPAALAVALLASALAVR